MKTFNPLKEGLMRTHPMMISLIVGGLLLAVSPVHASATGRRNTALGASGLALYQLARGHTGTGLLAAAGAGYAWNQYSKANRRRSRRSDFEAGYRAGVQRSYRYMNARRRSPR